MGRCAYRATVKQGIGIATTDNFGFFGAASGIGQIAASVTASLAR
jgi:hypothetical protein